MEKESLSSQKMDHFMKDHGKTIICRGSEGLSLKTHITREGYSMGQLKEKAHIRIVSKFIRETGKMIRGMEMEKRFSKIKGIDIRVILLTTNIMVTVSFKNRISRILDSLDRAYSKVKGLFAIKTEKYL